MLELGYPNDDFRPLHRFDVLEGGTVVFIVFLGDDKQNQVDLEIRIAEYFCLGPGFEEVVYTPSKPLDVFPVSSVLLFSEVADLLL